MASSRLGFVSINEAAATLGLKPWDVVRLVRTKQLESTELISVASLEKYQADTGRSSEEEVASL